MSASVRTSRTFWALCLAGALIAAPVLSLAQAPAKVVSINLCTDQLAMLVAAPGQLVSVSHLASDPYMSAMTEEAALLHQNLGLSEEIYLMQPDLVLAGQFTARATVNMLKRIGIPVVVFELENSLADVRSGLTKMGEVLGQQTRAGELISEFDATLSAYRDDASTRPRAALYYSNGFTSGDKTLAHQILETAGLSNVAVEKGYSAGGVIPLEVLAMAQPDAVITSRPYPGASRAEEVTRHPVVRSMQRNRRAGAMTNSDWVCGTPYVLRAIDNMVSLRTDILDEPE